MPLQNPSGTISLSPNPIGVTDGSGLGVTTVNFSANVPVSVYVNGTLFCGPMLSGSCSTGKWVTQRTGLHAGESGCQQRGAGYRSRPKCRPWRPPGPFRFRIRLWSPTEQDLPSSTSAFTANVVADLYADGTFFCGPATSTTCLTGKWVAEWYGLYAEGSRQRERLLATATAVVQGPSGTLSANPNPIIVTDGSGLGSNHHQLLGERTRQRLCERHALLRRRSTSGSCTTGKWVIKRHGVHVILLPPPTNCWQRSQPTVQNQ